MTEPFTQAGPTSSPGRWVLLRRATKGTCSGFPGLLKLTGSSHVENVVIFLISDFGVDCGLGGLEEENKKAPTSEVRIHSPSGS